MTNETLIQALHAAIGAEPDNLPEIMTAIKAVEVGSPIALKRVRRALSNALAGDRLDRLDDDARELCLTIVGSIPDDGGRLPDSDGKQSHIHLRVEASRKSSYVRAAQRSGESLSEWMTRHCDRESGV